MVVFKNLIFSIIPIFATLVERNTNGKLVYGKFFKVIIVFDVVIIATILSVVLIYVLCNKSVCGI